MRSKILIYGISVFLIMILQSTLLNSLEILNIKPNLVLVFIISVALIRGVSEGVYIGAFSGLLQDLVTGKIIGFYILIGLYIGLLVGIFNKRLYRENFLVIVFFNFIATIVYELYVFIFGIYIFNGKGLFYAISQVILPEAFYNVVISVFMYVFVIKISDLFSEQDKKVRKY